MMKTIPQFLETYGYRGRVVSIHRLHSLQKEIHSRHKQGFIDEDLYQTYLAKFVDKPLRNIMNARSLIVVAYGDPPVQFSFGWKGKTVHLTVPPTYLQTDAKDAEVVLDTDNFDRVCGIEILYPGHIKTFLEKIQPPSRSDDA